MGAGGRCLAVGELGGISRCCPAWQEDPAAGGAAQGIVVYLRARSCGASITPPDHRRGVVYVAGRSNREDQEGSLRFRGGGRGTGHCRGSYPVFRGSRKSAAQCPLLRWRSRTTHLPAAFLVEGSRSRYSRPLAGPYSTPK